ncbi:MAG: glycosyltransferase family 1 protein [Kiritimatiellae bacterium]|jgi:glycosyltransferase involved in cell wall biosynthesis|nr:glycosyltransferase family 1 protein [Kiritimatiellia bacterium]
MPLNKTYFFDARKAIFRYPDLKRYCDSLLLAMVPMLTKNESLHIIISDSNCLPGIIETGNVSLHNTHAKPGSIKNAFIIRRLQRKFKPDIHHAPNTNTYRPVKIKSIATIHEACPLSLPLNSTTLQSRLLFRLFSQRTLKCCSKIIGFSDNILKTYPQNTLQNKQTIIRYGISPRFTPQDQDLIDKVKNKYSLPRKFMLIIASDKNIHNLTTILDAIQSTDFTETSPLVIAGYGSSSEQITRQIEQRKLGTRVYQTGEISEDDMPALYSAAYTLLFPNKTKGIGLPIIEAMACGTPVICSTLPSLIEITGGCATLVHPTDKLEWIRAISTALLSINWQDESRAAALKHAQIFSWDKAAKETLDVYRSLCQ